MIRTLALLLIFAQPVFANPEAAREASRMIARAGAHLVEAREADDRARAMAGAVRAYEAGLASMREGLRAVALEERALATELAGERERLDRLLAALQQIEANAMAAPLLHPGGPLAALRAGHLLTGLSADAQIRTAVLRTRLDELRDLRHVQRLAEGDVRAGLAGLQVARAELSDAAHLRQGALPQMPDQSRLLADARNLSDFADTLASLYEGPDRSEDFAAEQGRLTSPVDGQVLRRFGEADSAGLERPGVVLAADARALVQSPAVATVRYAGVFAGYDGVVILEPQDGYLLVLGGLGVILVAAGEVVDAGDPLGLLAGEIPDHEDFLIEAAEGSGQNHQETLYIEMRDSGVPVDPAIWFAF